MVNYQCVVSLTTAGAKINVIDTKGCTPLHYAAASDAGRKVSPKNCTSLTVVDEEFTQMWQTWCYFQKVCSTDSVILCVYL